MGISLYFILLLKAQSLACFFICERCASSTHSHYFGWSFLCSFAMSASLLRFACCSYVIPCIVYCVASCRWLVHSRKTRLIIPQEQDRYALVQWPKNIDTHAIVWTKLRVSQYHVLFYALASCIHFPSFYLKGFYISLVEKKMPTKFLRHFGLILFFYPTLVYIILNPKSTKN